MPKLGKFRRAMRFSRKRRAAKAVRAFKRARVSRPLRQRTVVNTGQGFPKQIVMTHKYSDTIKITSTTSVIQNYLFSCNGMYDPDITGTGHQPMLFDQMTALYNHYCVIGSRIKIKVVPSSSFTKAVHCGIYINDNTSSSPANIGAVAEQPMGKVVQMAPNTTFAKVLTASWSAKKFFGKSPLANTDLQGTSLSNPNEQSYFNFCVQAFDGGTESVAIDVEISYIAVWKEFIDVAQS